MINFYLKVVIKLISDLFPIAIFNRTKILYKIQHPPTVIIKRYLRFKNIFRILKKLGNFSQIYDILEDQYSKRLFIRLISGRIFGFPNILVSPKADLFLKLRKSFFEKLYESNQTLKAGKYNPKLFNLKSIGFPIKLYNLNAGIIFIFLLEQYRYNHNKIIDVQKADIVIDAGGGWGDTALYFASKIGNFGKVFSFEFLERNVKIFKENINLNPNLKEIIEIIQDPIWNYSNKEINFYEDGVSGVAFFNNNKKELSQKLNTISIDDFVKEKNIPKIDFIKMDIEGAEVAALLGAKKTITNFRPKLAISIYHDLDHYYKIPYYLKSLNLNYKFYLDHFSTSRGETILFGMVPQDEND
ncbi:hypothetical protein LCGC14_0470070 [marine sediment metagenome]|uniref:Methyltransferase FkbM domain-containing protein n=1 Tax=marine sediment metagenome TaxID=412755 RepID=A0A0F9SVB2_9ZZZZ